MRTLQKYIGNCKGNGRHFSAETGRKPRPEQLQRIAQVVRSFETARHSLDGYDGQNANEFRRLTKHDFEAAIQDAVGELRTVRRYLEDRDAQERTEAPPATVEEVAALWRQVKDARRKYERVLARNLLTAHDEMQLGRLMRGEMELEHLDPEKDNVRGITAVYEARQAYERLVRPIRIWNQARKAALRQEADGYRKRRTTGTTSAPVSSIPCETMERNIRDIVPGRRTGGGDHSHVFHTGARSGGGGEPHEKPLPGPGAQIETVAQSGRGKSGIRGARRTASWRSGGQYSHAGTEPGPREDTRRKKSGGMARRCEEAVGRKSKAGRGKNPRGRGRIPQDL